MPTKPRKRASVLHYKVDATSQSFNYWPLPIIVVAATACVVLKCVMAKTPHHKAKAIPVDSNGSVVLTCLVPYHHPLPMLTISLIWGMVMLVPWWPQRENWFVNSYGWSPQLSGYMFCLSLTLIAGLALAWNSCRRLLWQHFLRGILASLTLLTGGCLLIIALYRVEEVFNYAYPSAKPQMILLMIGLSFATEIWFRGLWPAFFPSRAWWMAAANALLSGGWYITWVGQWNALPITTDHGWQAAILEAALSLLLLVLRWRGVSLYLLTLISSLLNLIGLSVHLIDYNPRAAFGDSLLRCAPVYLLLLGALLVVPVGWRVDRRLAAWAKFIMLCLLMLSVVCWPIYLAQRDNPQWQLNKDAPAKARWQADLDYLEREFPRRELDFPNQDTREGFAQELARLRVQAGNVSDAAMVVGVTHLIARLGIAHAYVDSLGKQPGLQYFPLELYWCSDGLIVVAAPSEELRPLIYTHVLRIGGYTPEEVGGRLTRFVAHEQASWVRCQMQYYSLWADLLQALDLVAPDGKLHLKLAASTGDSFDMVVPSNNVLRGWSVETPSVPFDTAPGPYRAYITRRHPKTLYVRYNANVDEPGSPAGSFDSFVQNIFARADLNGVVRLVVDLRFNHGGRFDAMAPLLKALEVHPIFRGSEHLAVLIGSGTFSAGVFDAVTLKERFGATLIGNPTGGLLTTYAETHWLILPNSKLHVGYATRLATCWYGRADPLQPDHPVRTATVAEYTAHQDPVYQAAISESISVP